jgi:hypothetical protein
MLINKIQSDLPPNKLEQYKKIIEKLKTIHWKDWIFIQSFNTIEFKDCCLALREFKILRRMEARQYTVSLSSKLLLHFFLDKMVMPERDKYKSFEMLTTGHKLIKAIRGAQNDPLMPSRLQSEMIPLIQQCMEWGQTLRQMEDKAVRKDVLRKIDGLQKGGKILVPAGCTGHTTCLLIEKTGKNAFKMIKYNTGKGVLDLHAQWRRTNRFQTFIIYEDIPKRSLTKKEHWKTLMHASMMQRDINIAYSAIHQLTEGGRKVEASNHPCHYEQKQATGTCAAQALMAYMRQQIMELEETPERGYAAYKLIKSRIFSQYGNKLLTKADETTVKAAKTKMDKLQAELAMADTARNQESFTASWSKLKKIMQTETAERLESLPKESIMMRYYTLRAASDAIARQWLISTRKAPIEVEPHHALALAKFKHQQKIASNMKKCLENCVDAKDWKALGFELYNIMIATPRPRWAINWLVQNYDRIGQETVNELFRLLSPYKIQGAEHIADIKKALQDAGQTIS